MYRVHEDDDDSSGSGRVRGGGGAVCTLPNVASVKADMKLLSLSFRRWCLLWPLALLLIEAVVDSLAWGPGTRGGRNGVREV